jgi:hypothetical protein
MENPICDMQTLYSPNRRYANTVNLVFFRAVPLTKNFQKYVDGLKSWKILMKKYYPESQLQVFVDKSIATDPEINKILFDLDARIFLFECPDYLRDDAFHIGLFGTMIRFYPFFDVNNHPMKIAHIQEVEPLPESWNLITEMRTASLKKFKYEMGLIYDSHNVFEVPPNYKNQSTFDDGVLYPWILAGRFIAMTKIPFELWKTYIQDIKNGKKFYNKYVHTQTKTATIKEHGNFSFGVDESFLNDVYLKWLIDNGYGVGFILRYKISYPVYYLREKVKKDPRSIKIFNYILQKDHTSIHNALEEFDKLFYIHDKTKRAIECAPRFYEIIEKYPNWLGISQSQFLLKVCNGYLSRTCLILTKDEKLIDVQDL